MLTGILTIHDTKNYGSLLQTYGLYRGITDLGYSCEIIDYYCETIYKKEFCPNIEGPPTIRKLLIYVYALLNNKRMRLHFRRFSHTFMRISEPYTKDTIAAANNRYDKFIVGSDMVWGADITGNDDTYFLDFVTDNQKKYAFSSSFGNRWERSADKEMKQKLSRFRQIAVREKEAAGWVEELLERKVYHVADPTLLVSSREWKKLAKKPKEKNYVLIYYRDPEGRILKDARAYADARNLQVLFIQTGIAPKGVKYILPLGIEEFLGYFLYAGAIFTASYHGMLFSIYFNKLFWYYNCSHQSRMNSVANRLGLQGREASHGWKEEKADYRIVNKKLEEFRNESIQVLAGYFKE